MRQHRKCVFLQQYKVGRKNWTGLLESLFIEERLPVMRNLGSSTSPQPLILQNLIFNLKRYCFWYLSTMQIMRFFLIILKINLQTKSEYPLLEYPTWREERILCNRHSKRCPFWCRTLTFQTGFVCFNESPLKRMKSVFYFILKILFVPKIFKCLPWLLQIFANVEKAAWLER